MEISTTEELFGFEVSKALGAEETILESLKDTIDLVENEQFKQALQEHATETEGQIETLKNLLQALGEIPKSVPSLTADALIQELDEVLTLVDADLQDIALAIAAEKIEFFEMATYTALMRSADRMGNRQVLEMLTDIYKQEENMARKVEQFSRELVAEAG